MCAVLLFLLSFMHCVMYGNDSAFVSTSSHRGKGLVRQPDDRFVKARYCKVQYAEVRLEIASLGLNDFWGKELFVSSKVQEKIMPALEVEGEYGYVSAEIVKALNGIGVSVYFLNDTTIALVETPVTK
jgi:hypothetical protein